MKIYNYNLLKSIPLKDMWKWQHLEQTIHTTMNFFNYTEIRPALFLANEVIEKVYKTEQNPSIMEDFFQVNSHENMCLRPDGTITCLHDLINDDDLSGLNLVYYLGPMFRKNDKEPFHKGQFQQFGAEAIGVDSYLIDVETIRLGFNIFNKFGLSNIRLEINSYGCPDCRPNYLKKLGTYWDKVKKDLCPDCSKDYRHFATKSDTCEHCSQVWLNSPSILNELCNACQNSFNQIKRTLANLMLDFVVNPHLNMSFPYYNKIVFQYKIADKEEHMMLGGGGRYDNLVRSFSGNKLPAVGFSANLNLLMSLLEEKGLLPQQEAPFKVYAVATNTQLETSLLQIVQELRDNETKVVIGETNTNYKHQVKNAQKEGCSLIIVINEDSIREGKVFIDNLVKKHKETINLRDILSTIQRLQKTLQKK